MKKKVIIILVMVLLIAVVTGIVLASKNNDKGEDNKKSSNVKLDTVENVEQFIEKVYEDGKEELPSLETREVNIDDEYELTYTTGLSSNEKIEFAVVSEPLMNSQAYSLVFVKVKDEKDIEDVKKEMYENIDTRKWICVEAEKLYVTNYEDVVMLLMANEDWSKTVYDSIKDKLSGLGKELTK